MTQNSIFMTENTVFVNQMTQNTIYITAFFGAGRRNLNIHTRRT